MSSNLPTNTQSPSRKPLLSMDPLPTASSIRSGAQGNQQDPKTQHNASSTLNQAQPIGRYNRSQLLEQPNSQAHNYARVQEGPPNKRFRMSISSVNLPPAMNIRCGSRSNPDYQQRRIQQRPGAANAFCGPNAINQTRYTKNNNGDVSKPADTALMLRTLGKLCLHYRGLWQSRVANQESTVSPPNPSPPLPDGRNKEGYVNAQGEQSETLQIEQLRKETNYWKENAARLEQENIKCGQVLGEMEKKFQVLTKQITDGRGANASGTVQIGDTRQENHDLKQHNAKVQQQLTGQHVGATESPSNEKPAMEMDMVRENAHLKEIVKHMEERLRRVVPERNGLRDLVERCKKESVHRSKYEQVKKERDDLNREKEATRKEFEETKEKLQRANDGCNHLGKHFKELNMLKGKMQALPAVLERLKRLNEEKTQLKDGVRRVFDEMIHEFEAERGRIKKATLDIVDALTKQNSERNQQLQSQKVQYDELSRRHEIAMKMISGLKVQTIKEKESTKSISSDLREKEKELGETQQAKRDVETRLERALAEVESDTNLIEELKKAEKEKTIQLQQKEDNLKSLQGINKKLDSELESLRALKETAESDLERVQDESNKMKKQMDQLKKKEDEVKKKEKEMKMGQIEQDSKKEELEIEKNRLRAELEEKEEQLKRKEEEWKACKEKMQADFTRMLEVCSGNKTNSGLDGVGCMLSAKSEQREEMVSELKKKESALQHLKEELKKMKKEKEELSIQSQQLQTEATNQRQQLEDKLNQAESQRDTMKSDLRVSRRNSRNVCQRKQQITRRWAELDQKMTGQMEQEQRIRLELDQAKSELDAANQYAKNLVKFRSLHVEMMRTASTWQNQVKNYIGQIDPILRNDCHRVLNKFFLDFQSSMSGVHNATLRDGQERQAGKEGQGDQAGQGGQ